ncbi:transcriptional regulator, IclR family [Gordonia polyisoprenivorans VH2]|uniref:Transcriptional regulator, IclR family n=2 Tax=Gordonia polyisoprenivorans TaxID=84595 RepID=H6MUM8_GORPV|nr:MULTISPECIES: IclR family transcriptional regulator [Gordonia]AFA74012.1 transcriptional regulator, IclR family [Gordonia polyisoprenivorans VH2]MDF3280439.1 IclR family transcriptional regulator [Gordonia sp. N1V]NKY03668.1 IclR family transcriptional regulator [Gordonia polyisoprenivorans]OPX14554.1 IclR family transcriptional regulator [Gordonia sp. i37]OZC31126.1 IclR family transcriptional regulator [Gordonia polyisoprenivorans]
MGKDSASEPSSGIGVLDKSVTVLRAIAETPCNLTELCERTSLPRATAHRLAVGLETHRLLARNAAGRWYPGPALGELASSAHDPVREAALMVLPRLREITGESVQVYRREGSERVCIAAMEPPTGLRDTVPVGTRFPMTAGSAAKVLAAWADTSTQRHLLADSAFSDRSLHDIRRRGWAQSAGERAAGVASVSAPVRDAAGEVVAAISVSGPIDRMGRRPGARWAADLLAAADAIHKRLVSAR